MSCSAGWSRGSGGAPVASGPWHLTPWAGTPAGHRALRWTPRGGMCPARYIYTPASHAGSDPGSLIGRSGAPPLINIKAKRGGCHWLCGRLEPPGEEGGGGWMWSWRGGWRWWAGREGGRRVGVLREKATSVLHAYFIKEKWRDGERAWKESDGQARLCAGLGRGEAAAEAAGPTAQLSVVWVRVQGRLRARALLAHTRVSACKQPAACITRPWVCTWGR